MRAAAPRIANHVAVLVVGGARALRAGQIKRDKHSSRVVSFSQQIVRFELSTDGLVERKTLVVGRAYYQCAVPRLVASNIFARDRPITFLRSAIATIRRCSPSRAAASVIFSAAARATASRSSGSRWRRMV